MVKDFVELGEFSSLDDLIVRLTLIRDGLAAGAEAELRIRGDDTFGRHLAVGYMRPLTEEEAACEGRYAHYLDDRELRAAA